MKGSSILIIGAGLGGLALAQGLVRSGFNVTVFERDQSPSSRAQGYRISIRSLGMQALSRLLTPEKMNRLSLAKVDDVGDGFTCANEKMEPLLRIPRGQDAVVQFLRTELRVTNRGCSTPLRARKASIRMAIGTARAPARINPCNISFKVTFV
jgi:2-polyprenyl-6-methoxyphenol hydroxylase-like FAD-dependent oxidoreductase